MNVCGKFVLVLLIARIALMPCASLAQDTSTLPYMNPIAFASRARRGPGAPNDAGREGIATRKPGPGDPAP
jgi:hypothetical protein